MHRADEYRQKAAECRQQAKLSITPLDRQQWVRLAEHWLKLGEAPETGKCEGRKSYAEARLDTVALVKQLEAEGLSYRKIAAELAARGHVTSGGKPHVASAIHKMLGR
jgi:hypothetical protein